MMSPLFLQYYPDKAVQREVLELIVLCSYSKYGCPWQGQLQHFEVGTHQLSGVLQFIAVLSR